MIKSTMLNVLLLLAGSMAFVSSTLGVALYLKGQRKKRRDENLCFWLAQAVGGMCLEGPWSGFREFTEGLLDWGFADLSTNYVVRAQDGDREVVFFEARGGSSNPSEVPVWSGCILKTAGSFPLPMVVFRGDGGECEETGRQRIPCNWNWVEVREGPLRGYTVASPDVVRAMEVLRNRVARVLARVARTIEGSIMPECLALQVVGDKVALYTYEHGLAEVDHYLALYRGVTKLAASLAEVEKVA